jgi:hypothetical protein
LYSRFWRGDEGSMRQIDLLWELQKTDSRIGELERKLDMYSSKEKLKEIKSKFDEEKGLLDKNELLLKETVKSTRANRAKAEELKYNYQKTEEKLYSGNVSNVKQLEGMQKNLEEMQRNIQTLENICKVYEDEKKSLEDQIKKSKIKLVKFKNTFDVLKEKYINGEEKVKKEYEDLKEKREELIKKIEERVLNRYNRVRLGTDTAVVLIEDGKCSGCHMEVSVICLEKLKEEKMINCETCGRILYMKLE